MMNPVGRDVEIRKRRVSLHGPVKVAQKTGGNPELLEFTDLSMGGLFVKTTYPSDIGSELDLELRTLRLPFRAKATVAWVRASEQGPDKPSGMGLAFQDLSTLQRKALYRQIDEALQQGSESMPGTPPSRSELSARASRSGKQKKSSGSWWSRIFRH